MLQSAPRATSRIKHLSTVMGLCCCFAPAIAVADPSGCSDIGVLVTTTPAPPITERSWRHQLRQVQDLRAAPRPDILIVGDSIALGWPSIMWSPWKVGNLGVAGDKTQHLLWRLAAPELAEAHPARILVVLGTNNIGAQDEACAIVAGLDRVFARIKALWPKAEIIYLLNTVRAGKQEAVRSEVNSVISQRSDVISYDIASALGCDGESCSGMLPDKVHFKPEGYSAITAFLQRHGLSGSVSHQR